MKPSEVASQRTQYLGAGKKHKPFLIFDFALRRGPVILLIGTIFTLCLALLLLPMASPVFEANGILLIDPTKEITLTGREKDQIPGDFGDWTRTQIRRMTSEDVLMEAILRTPTEDLPYFISNDPQNPANVFRLMKRIRIQEVPRTYLIRLTIRNDTPHGIAEMLNTVMEVYLEKIEREFESTYVRRKEYLVTEREKISARLAVEEQRLLKLAETVPNKSFLHENYNVHLNKVEQLQRLYWEAFSAAAENKAQLSKVQEDRRRISEMSLQAFADARVADNFGINRIEQWTYEQLQKMRAQIDGLTPTNQDRVYVESRMEAMNDYLKSYKQRVNDETIRNLKEKQDYELAMQELMAKSASEAGKKRVAQLGMRLKEAREEASRISLAIFQATNPTFARMQLRYRLQALNNRIDDTEMQAKAPLRVSVDKYAAPPVGPDSTNALFILLISVVVGFGPIGASLLIYEIADTRLRNRKEIEKALGGPAPDPINTMVTPVGIDSDFPRVTLSSPGNLAAQHIKDLASRIVNDHQSYGSQVYVLAGLGRNCGTTSISLNLAHAVRSLCDRILLIEISPLHPGLCSLVGCKKMKGIESYLRGEIDERQLICQDEERNLDFIISEGGERPPQMERFNSLLADLSQDYEMVIIDAGAFPENISAHVMRQAEALLLVARYKKTYFSELRKAIDLAIQSGVPAVTSILNFTESRETPYVVSAIEKTVILISTQVEKLSSFLRRKK